MYKFQGNCIHVENQCKKIMYMAYWKEKGFRESFLICSKCYDSDYKGREGLQGAVELIQSKGRLNICIIKDNHICAANNRGASTDRPEDLRLQQAIRSRADYSLAILGNAFVRNGSGRFLNIRQATEIIGEKKSSTRH
jgi:hypothetical protein